MRSVDKPLITVSDETKLKKFKHNADNCPSFKTRTSLAQELCDDGFNIREEDGFFMYHAYDDTDVINIVNDARSIVSSKDVIEWSKQKTSRYVRSDLIDETTLNLDSSYLKFALRKDIIATVSKYFGHVPVLASVSMLYSRHVSDQFLKTQLYHCDFEDVKNLKIFINATDLLDKSYGPLTVVSASDSKVIRQNMLGKYAGEKIQLSLNNERQYIKPDMEHAMLGKSGTVMFADACSCFHYGSRIKAKNKDRAVVVLHYLSPAAININISEYKPFAKLNSDVLNVYQKYIIGCE